MKFELETLDRYDNSDLIEELKRVSKLVEGIRLTMSKFDEFSKVHSSTVRNRFDGWSNALEKAGLSQGVSPQARQINRKEIIDLVKQVAQEIDTETLTIKQFTDKTGIGQKAILSKFNNWRQALDEAGLTPVALGRRYSEEECFENILKLWTHVGRQPNYAELKQNPSSVGPKAYIGRWGSWRKALRTFVDNMESTVNDTSSLDEVPQKLSSSQTPEMNKKRGVPGSLSLSVRYNILKRDNFKCVICGRSPANTFGVTLHVDHKVARAREGTNDLSNLRTLCFDCNLGKGAKNE